MPLRQSDRAAGNDARKAKSEASTPPTKFDLKWQEIGEVNSKGIKPLLILDGPGAVHSATVAAFDLDWTIVRTISGEEMGQSLDDWEILNDTVVPKLKELHDAGNKIVFFTNQSVIEKGLTDVKIVTRKVGNIIDAVGIPIQVFISTGFDHYRKPSPEMWKYMAENCNGGISIDFTKSMFVGDAAGRPKNWKSNTSRKDFSCGDRKFALNVGIQFYTPEEFFLGEKPYADFEWRSINPKEFYEKVKDEQAPDKLHADAQEMVVMVGRPASGKSTITKHYFIPNGYIQINRDTIGTQEKCLKAATSALKDGKSVVIDNTNPNIAARKSYIDLAAKHKVPCRCIYIDIPTELSRHLNFVRLRQTKGIVRLIPEVAYHTYEKDFEAPDKSEGYADVRKIGFIPIFQSDEEKDIFLQWSGDA